MNSIQNYGMTNYQIGFHSKKATVDSAKQQLEKLRTTKYFRDIYKSNEILTEEESKEVQAILEKYGLLKKATKAEIKSPDGDVLFIANPTQENIQAMTLKEKKDIEAAAQSMSDKSFALSSPKERMEAMSKLAELA